LAVKAEIPVASRTLGQDIAAGAEGVPAVRVCTDDFFTVVVRPTSAALAFEIGACRIFASWDETVALLWQWHVTQQSEWQRSHSHRCSSTECVVPALGCAGNRISL
jgi:hypothetical protein